MVLIFHQVPLANLLQSYKVSNKQNLNLIKIIISTKGLSACGALGDCVSALASRTPQHPKTPVPATFEKIRLVTSWLLVLLSLILPLELI